MKKKILTMLAGTMLATSVSFAAPITDLQQGQTSIGYNHYNLSHDMDDDSFYLESAVSNKFILGAERNSYDGFHSTDIYAQYKLDPNIRLIVGNRDYSFDGSKMFYGIGGVANLAPKLDGYAGVTTSSVFTEWQTGLNYKLDNQLALHLGYKSTNYDDGPTDDGIGFGASYKF
ncbi:outer membrane protein [Sporomusa acidovorans]|uniref:Outer membrane protein beta-barrel domain-containing protein n=1 Tax=Sporomusa acidovorans (strain ATCC 49682 / DSM 3132 / Mol) TaxID=1123286 RepID=A0ABZ3JBC1_SPOA4|nr:hypothetical protein [Sporomusa acidovorans]OZC21809.1 hypothetical protein SPACI_18840 [Sporomusa acidovorans DSM 3132]SDD56214.1 hypothetical protein SAMN04488499_100249 [Sporomusa acidovorans]